ncbi:tRNA splicing endonuclease subunit sen2 [Neurospora sp. IMI 360204]|nr:tRNA splicing endonuclease subunit sen2 [Neurospora sp. IMI 360204]
MAENMTTTTMSQPSESPSKPGEEAPASTNPAASSAPPRPQRVPYHQIYKLPAPIRTFPLPTFYPSNPLSLFHLAVAWLRQVLLPPSAEPSVIHEGIWDPDTRSVHVKDPKSIRALWEQGFYGKGSLSRSEPNWFKRELSRRGLDGTTVSEERTVSRREERKQVKWERAKAELEAIEKQKLEEAKLNSETVNAAVPESLAAESEPEPQVLPAHLPDPVLSATSTASTSQAAPTDEFVPKTVAHGYIVEPKPPVGPLELLALPNSYALVRCEEPVLSQPEPATTGENVRKEFKPPVGPIELLALPNSLADLVALSVVSVLSNDIGIDEDESSAASALTNDEPETSATKVTDTTSSVSSPLSTDGQPDSQPAQEDTPATPERRKSVRFSPTVESTTFQHTDAASEVKNNNGSSDVEAISSAVPAVEKPVISNVEPTVFSEELVDKEHFQLAPEEAFFLAFGLGALRVVDPVTKAPISNEQLLIKLRANSYFPPRSVDNLSPEDPFLVQYAVYHHFRSLGWVPRHGIKFGVDWIIYQRGPVFDHSEFGIMVVPSFSDPRWSEYEHEESKKTWSWLMGVNRVLAHVLKSLVLVYVDVPPPPVFDEEMKKGGIAAALKKFTIREVMVRRFSVNRNR